MRTDLVLTKETVSCLHVIPTYMSSLWLRTCSLDCGFRTAFAKAMGWRISCDNPKLSS